MVGRTGTGDPQSIGSVSNRKIGTTQREVLERLKERERREM